MMVFNLHGDEWDEQRDREGRRLREVFVGERAGSRLIWEGEG